jgi:hypothetical protein
MIIGSSLANQLVAQHEKTVPQLVKYRLDPRDSFLISGDQVYCVDLFPVPNPDKQFSKTKVIVSIVLKRSSNSCKG